MVSIFSVMHSIRYMFYLENYTLWRGRRGGDRMVVECITTYAIIADYQNNYVFESRSSKVVHNTALCDKDVEVTCGRSVVFLWYSGFFYQ